MRGAGDVRTQRHEGPFGAHTAATSPAKAQAAKSNPKRQVSTSVKAASTSVGDWGSGKR
jgi:hypothetical protein